MASVTVQTTSAAGVRSDAEVKPFTNGKVSFSETIRGGDVIEVTGLPTGAAYTITESGLDAEKYTTAWTLDGETLSTERALPTQTVGAADTALTVTNTRSSIAPTGLLLDAAPYGAPHFVCAPGHKLHLIIIYYLFIICSIRGMIYLTPISITKRSDPF